MAKGNASTHIYTDKGRNNHGGVVMNHEPVGPTVQYVHRFYPGKYLTLPVGVTAGKHWVRK